MARVTTTYLAEIARRNQAARLKAAHEEGVRIWLSAIVNSVVTACNNDAYRGNQNKPEDDAVFNDHQHKPLQTNWIKEGRRT